MKKYPALLLVLVFLFSCSHSKNDEKPIARVFDSYLYPSDVKGIIKPGLSNRDSMQLLKNYVDEWVRQHLLLAKAEDNVDIDKKELEKKMNDYRESLVIYQYENELIRQKLDTAVTQNQLMDYYNNHRDNFGLKFDLIKLSYIKIKTTDPALMNIKRMYNDGATPVSVLQDVCKKSAQQFSIGDSSWFMVDELGKVMPQQLQDKLATSKGYSEYKDSAFTYLINVKSFLPKGNMSPINFVKDNIYKIIVNQRKVEMIKTIREEIYKDALQRGDFESI